MLAAVGRTLVTLVILGPRVQPSNDLVCKARVYAHGEALIKFRPLVPALTSAIRMCMLAAALGRRNLCNR